MNHDRAQLEALSSRPAADTDPAITDREALRDLGEALRDRAFGGEYPRGMDEMDVYVLFQRAVKVPR